MVDEDGKISQVKIVRAFSNVVDRSAWIPDTDTDSIDPYYAEYLSGLPPVEAFIYDERYGYNKRINHPTLYLWVLTEPPFYQSKQEYTKLFRQKYTVFKDKAITSINEAELKYYVASASKLGWINCDYFWNTEDEKIDYVVKVDGSAKPNVKLVFKNAKSIMEGHVEGDKCIFRNIPAGQEVKIVSIAFNGSKPMLSVAQTKTGKEVYDKLAYKEFALGELERELGGE